MWLKAPKFGTLDRSQLGDVKEEKPPSSGPAFELRNIPDGDEGTIATLKIMRKFARDAVVDPNQSIRQKGLQIFSGVAPRQWWQEIRALHAFVRDQIRYTRDPIGVELVQTPQVTLQLGQGDCDDKATLLAALLQATGHPARFVAVGFDAGPFSHVLVETQCGDRWVPMETIIPVELGWYPPKVRRAYRLKV